MKNILHINEVTMVTNEMSDVQVENEQESKQL